MPDFAFERKLWRKGFKVIAGADEVGRGAWAGPVVASAVAFAPNSKLQILNSKIRINDSKLLSQKQREKAEKWIKKNCLAWGVGEASVSVINRLGLGKATQIAFRRAIAECNKRLVTTDYSLQQKTKPVVRRLWTVDFLLIDAFYLPYTKGIKRKNQFAIVKGDTKSISIASASILAKVYRDKLMVRFAQKHKRYAWGQNKGYGTKSHQKAILKYGLTRLHRKQFVRNLKDKGLPRSLSLTRPRSQ